MQFSYNIMIWPAPYHGLFLVSLTFFPCHLHNNTTLLASSTLFYCLFADLLPLTSTCAPSARFESLVAHVLDHSWMWWFLDSSFPHLWNHAPLEDGKISVHWTNIRWQHDYIVKKLRSSAEYWIYSVYVGRKALDQTLQTLNHNILSAITKIQLANHAGSK